MKQILAAIWLFLAIVANAEASPADEATAVLRKYYDAVSEHDCKRAIQLRPGYTGCESIESISRLPEVTGSWEFERWVILRFNVAFVRSGEDQTFDGYVLLENAGEKWVLKSNSVSSVGDLRTYIHKLKTLELEDAFDAARKLPEYAGEPEGTGESAQENKAITETDPEMTQDVASDTKQTDTGTVAQHSPGYSDTAAGQAPKVQLDKNANSGPCVSEVCQSDTLMKTRDEIRRYWGDKRLRLAVAKDTTHPAPTVSPPGIETAGGQWPGEHGEVFGSAAILNACFDGKALRERPGEKKADKHSPLALMGAPKRLRPLAPDYSVDKQYLRSIRRVDTGGKRLVALGFDIGEQNNDFAGYDGAIIDYLRAHKVKATLYMGGKWMATHPERTKQLIADPLFEMGNHAWTHGNFRVLDRRSIEDQIYYTEAQYELLREELLASECASKNGREEANKIPPRLMTFRFPYGTCRSEALDLVNAAGLPAVQWDTVTADPAWSQTSAAIAKVLINVKPGAIVVMHANGRGWNTAKALPVAIPELRKRGFEFVTVTELLQRGEPVVARECYERKPGDNKHYDRIFGRGTGD